MEVLRTAFRRFIVEAHTSFSFYHGFQRADRKAYMQSAEIRFMIQCNSFVRRIGY